ncbi:MAG: hypothetical protein GY927_10995 [bacterium]|nr:hypothetical protein [bacterium]
MLIHHYKKAPRLGALFMAETVSESSNHILETLEEWNDYLGRYAPYYQDADKPHISTNTTSSIKAAFNKPESPP